MVCTLKIWTLIWIIPAIDSYIEGGTQDQTSTRPNTLFDDADDIQKQLDNEARDRMKFGRPKTIWVFHLPSFPSSTTATFLNSSLQNVKRSSKAKSSRKNKLLATGIKNWDYVGQKKWSLQYPECGGRSQSPIDLPTQGLIKARAGRQLVFSNYDAMPEKLILRDDGKKLILYGSWRPGFRPLIYGGAAHSRRYLFHSLTLHWPSEHFVGGFQYPMESQVIHVSAEYNSLKEAVAASKRDPLAMLGIANLYMLGNNTQASLEELLTASKNMGIGNRTMKRRRLYDYSPPFKEYVTYQGSLTSPPCTESVLWMVRARSLTMTRATSALAHALVAPSGELRRSLMRQIQPRNDRKIFFFH